MTYTYEKTVTKTELKKVKPSDLYEDHGNPKQKILSLLKENGLSVVAFRAPVVGETYITWDYLIEEAIDPWKEHHCRFIVEQVKYAPEGFWE